MLTPYFSIGICGLGRNEWTSRKHIHDLSCRTLVELLGSRSASLHRRCEAGHTTAIYGRGDLWSSRPASFPLVREIGFGNLSIGLLGICSIIRADWIVPAAIVGGLYYGLAGLGHIPQKNKNAKEYTAMISDLFVALLLGAFLIA